MFVCEQSGVLLYSCRWWAQRMASWTLMIPQPYTPTLPSPLPPRLKWLTKPSKKQLSKCIEDCAASSRVQFNSILLSPNPVLIWKQIRNLLHSLLNLFRFSFCCFLVPPCDFNQWKWQSIPARNGKPVTSISTFTCIQETRLHLYMHCNNLVKYVYTQAQVFLTYCNYF